jgi:hypothetical protein
MLRILLPAAVALLVALRPLPAGAEPDPAVVAPASQPLLPGSIVPGKTLQPGEPGYKSPAVAAAWSFATTLLPLIVGGFAVRAQSQVAMWTGFGLIVGAQSFGPTAGYWYANERARFTFARFGLTMAAFGAAIYPLYAYTGQLDSYSSPLAASLTVLAVITEAVALSLAAWDMSSLGETIERHNFKPGAPPASAPSAPRARAGVRLGLAPVLMAGGGGLALGGRY